MERISRNTQAVCGFKYLASKRTPFFQTVKVIAAILRASVRRAISGLIPLATSASFYKGESQEKHLSFGRRFSCFPAHMIEQDLFQPSAPGARFAAHCCVAVLVFTSSGFHRLLRDEASLF